MKEFDVTITETLEKNVKVEAASREDAEEAVKKAYYNSEYVLDAENFTGVQFTTQAERDIQQEQKPTMDVIMVKEVITFGQHSPTDNRLAERDAR